MPSHPFVDTLEGVEGVEEISRTDHCGETLTSTGTDRGGHIPGGLMHPETIFITRYVASHEASLPWYEKFFGRSPDAEPVPSCREWRLSQGVLFQVIEDAGRQGEQSVAFGVADLTATASVLAESGLEMAEASAVDGFTTLRYTEIRDPEGVPLGLLDGE